MEVQLELGIFSQWGPRIGGSDCNYPAINGEVMIHSMRRVDFQGVWFELKGVDTDGYSNGVYRAMARDASKAFG